MSSPTVVVARSGPALFPAVNVTPYSPDGTCCQYGTFLFPELCPLFPLGHGVIDERFLERTLGLPRNLELCIVVLA